LPNARASVTPHPHVELPTLALDGQREWSRMGYLAIQWIKLAYSDEQRGMKHANKRARLRAFPLPEAADGDGIVHEIRADSRQAVEPAATTHAIALCDGSLSLSDGFRITCVERNLALLGPYACPARPLFIVPIGTWGRVLWNAKDDDGIVEYIVNAGRFALPPRRTVFRGLPTVERDLRRALQSG
jgi:hypothetical protein